MVMNSRIEVIKTLRLTDRDRHGTFSVDDTTSCFRCGSDGSGRAGGPRRPSTGTLVRRLAARSAGAHHSVRAASVPEGDLDDRTVAGRPQSQLRHGAGA